MKSVLLVSALVSGVLGLGGLAAQRMGPPIICQPIAIGDARSIPFGEGAFSKTGGYSAAKVLDDTIAVLKAQRDPLVHMETLRRASVYIGTPLA